MKLGSAKSSFCDVNNKKRRKWWKFLPLLFNNPNDLLVFTTEFKCPNQVFYVWLVDLMSICAKYGLETWFTPNDDIRKCLFDMKQGSIKNAFCGVHNKKWRKWCEFVSPFLFNNAYGYLCSQWTPNVLIKNFFFFFYYIGAGNITLRLLRFLVGASTWSIFKSKMRFYV
jgi:hypothetical protein